MLKVLLKEDILFHEDPSEYIEGPGETKYNEGDILEVHSDYADRLEPYVEFIEEAEGTDEDIEEGIVLEEMSLKELVEFAKDNEIDLKGAKKKGDILSVIEALGEEAEGIDEGDCN